MLNTGWIFQKPADLDINCFIKSLIWFSAVFQNVYTCLYCLSTFKAKSSAIRDKLKKFDKHFLTVNLFQASINFLPFLHPYLQRILLLIGNKFNKFNNTGARMLDSYNKLFKAFCDQGCICFNIWQ